MAIQKYLDISTAHVPFNFDKIKIPFRRVKHEYGWILYVTDELDENDVNSLINDGNGFIIEIWKFAKSNDCNLVNLDADAEVVDELQQFEW